MTIRATFRFRAWIPHRLRFFINPERIRSQIEGAAVDGLSLAKLTQITFKTEESTDNSTTTRCVVSAKVRWTYGPTIVPATIDDPSSGVGERSSAVAPAFINAIYAATGKRIQPAARGSTDA